MCSFLALSLLAAIVTANAFPNIVFEEHPRIVGGEKVQIEEFPHQISILSFNGEYVCGGSIINKNHVLTAGHCVNFINNGYIRAGSNYSYDDGSFYRISQIISHENYAEYRTGVLNDIAILRIEPPFVFSDALSPVPLINRIDRDADVGMMSTVSGFGDTGERLRGNGNLRAVSVPIVSREECSRNYSSINWMEIKEDKICAGYKEGGKDSCQGDSGSAVLINGYQVGVVSYGYGCARPRFPGVYTNVAYFADWIAKNSAEEPEDDY